MTQTAQSSWTKRNCEASDAWVSEPELIALLAPRSYERPGVTSGFWQGVRFAFLFVAPVYLLGIWLWLR
jgi:hypothetical protein